MKTLLRSVACVALLLACIGCAQKRILLVSQYGPGHPCTVAVEDTLRQALQKENMAPPIRTFDINTLGHPTEMWRDEMGRMAVVRAQAWNPSVIVAVGDEAARYFVQRLAGTSRRFVFVGLKGDPADYKFGNALNVTGVREDVPVHEAFALMKDLVPSARRVAVLADAGLDGDAVVRRIQAAGTLPLEVSVVKRAQTIEQWLAAVQEVQTQADLLCLASYEAVIADPAVNDALPGDEVLRRTAQANRLPDFSFRADAVGPEGVMAAVTCPIEKQAEIAASMAIGVMYYFKDIGRMRVETCTAREEAVSPERAAQLGITLVPE